MRAALVGVLAALLCLGAAQAAPSKRHPDLSGYWMLTRKEVSDDPQLKAQLPPGAAILRDTGPTEFPRGEYGGLKLTPKAQDVEKAWNPRDDLGIAKVCQPPSIVYAMQGPFPIQIYQGTEFIIIRLEYYDMMRIVFMDGRPHLPADAPHTKTGDSIGHWEGNELVVDTDHLEPSTIANNGLFHSENIHVIERFKLSPDGKTLLSTQQFTDPEMIQNPGARFIVFDKQPGEYIYPYDCDPTFGLNYGAPTK